MTRVASQTFGLSVLLLIAACAGQGAESFEDVLGPDGEVDDGGPSGPTETPSDTPDRDADGVADGQDRCPAQPEVFNNFGDGDGCPDSLATLISLVAPDVDGFWSSAFASAGYTTYLSPYDVRGYIAPFLSACGFLSLENAYYCPGSHGIYYDYNWLDRWLYGVGDFAPAFILAHEWGHAVQALLGYTRLDFYSIQLELQADCLGGAWSHSAEARGMLEEGDVDEAVRSLLYLGDRNTPWFHPQAHGTAEQRVESFLRGYRAGSSACVIPRIDGSLQRMPLKTPVP
jgi:predicted metalloprotease